MSLNLEQKVIINCRFLTQKITGVQRYAIELCKELNKSDIKVEFVAPKNIIHHDIAKELNVKILGKGFLKGHLWEQIILQLYVFRKRNLLISFCNTAPIFVKNQIVTIHDLAFLVNPEWVSKSFGLVYSFMIPFLAKKAAHVITVSNTSKKEIVKKLMIPEEKITVIYNAISSVFQNKKQNNNNRCNNYILTVSSHHPRKNFKNLISAFKLIPDIDLELLVVGNFNKYFSESNIDLGNDTRIKFLKDISDAELASLYENARLFVYPSVYEGFGIPIIEAMSQGTPICVSDIEVFHEICGENGVYFNPLDIHDIKNKMITSLESHTIVDYDLQKYSWNKSFRKLEKCIFAIQNQL